MTLVRRLLRRFRYLLDGRSLDRGMDEEMRFHLEREIEKHVRSGLTGEAARRAAHLSFGGVERHREGVREARGTMTAEHLLRDVGFALRKARKRPGFAAVIVLTLALGIGANAAMYRLYDALLLRDLPVRDPESLVVLELADMSRWVGRRTTGYPVLSNPIWERVREGDGGVDAPLAWANAAFTLGTSDVPEVTRGLFISGGFFQALAVQPAAGRLIDGNDDRLGCAPGAVLSHAFWQRRFGADPSVVGRTVELNSTTVPVLGVAPDGFLGLEVGRSFDVAVPICSHAVLGDEAGWLEGGTTWWLTVMGRIPVGETLGATNDRLAGASPPIFEATLPPDYPSERVEDYRAYVLRAAPASAGMSAIRSRYADPLLILLVVTTVVLLIACANLVALFQARSTVEENEFAMRRAFGASNGRLLSQSLVETLLLAAAGGTLGVFISDFVSRYLASYLGAASTLALPTDARVTAFVLGVTIACGLACGAVPAWRAARGGGADRVRHTRGIGRARGNRMRQALLVGQIALSFALVYAAALFTRTLGNLRSVDAGFATEQVTVARVHLDESDLRTQVLESLRSVAGVEAAAEVRHVPLGGTGSSASLWLDGADPGTARTVRLNAVTDGYLETMEIPLIAGRAPVSSDDTRAALVNPTLAAALGLGGDPLGARFHMEGVEGLWEIVGLVPDTKYFTLREDPIPIVLVPKAQMPDPRPLGDFVVRSAVPPDQIGPALARAVAQIVPGARVETRALATSIQDGLARERLLATLSALFGLLAVIVAAVGLYGSLAYQMTQRAGELALRIALGAGRGEILAVVVRQGVAVVLVGLAFGTSLALAGAARARTLLFGLDAFEPRSLALAAVLYGLVALLACGVPTRRALRTAPRDVLNEG